MNELRNKIKQKRETWETEKLTWSTSRWKQPINNLQKKKLKSKLNNYRLGMVKRKKPLQRNKAGNQLSETNLQ